MSRHVVLKPLGSDKVKLFNALVPTIGDLAMRRQSVVTFAVTLPEGAEGNIDLFEAVNRAGRGSRPFGLVAIGKSEARSLHQQIRIDGREPHGEEESTQVG